MSEFGWTRLAYLTVILAVISILVKLGAVGADSLPEAFPKSALAFAQREPISEEDLDWGNRKNRETRADEIPEATVSRDIRGGERDREVRDLSREPVGSIYENVNFVEDVPVFYRPTPRVSGDSRNPSSSGMAAKSCQTVGDAPSGSKILFPLARELFDSYEDTWGAARPQGGHEGADMMAPMGTPEYAITDGTVVPVSGSNSNGWNTLGGYTVMIEAAYSVGPVKKGDLFYYAHMDGRSDLQIGDTVKAGDVVGYAGDTGEGPEGTRGLFPSHLHLGWYETSGERTQLASGAMNPYPLLEWIKANGGSIEGGSNVPYCEAPQPASPTPSDGGYWQFPSDPGVRPDMSTETDDAAPSPVARQNASSELSPEIPREKHRPDRPAKPNKPDRSADAEPPEKTDEPSETTEPPRNGAPPFPNPDVGGIGDGIRDVIEDILGPGNPERPPKNDGESRGPTRPAPPREDTDIEAPEETVPETTPPETANPEEDPECELRERPGKEADEEARPDEDCHGEDTTAGEPPPEETTSEEDTSIEETTSEETENAPAEPASEQYESEDSEMETEVPQRPGTSPGTSPGS